ncbi:hypothetical protein [Streptomyces sp. NPDC059928]|uniref:hypothetical protein n=1 Tax=unclassified Streptomyces TaxID=2593676 RepID=UPI00366A1715
MRRAAPKARKRAARSEEVEREQRVVVPRQHTEQVTVDGQDHDVRRGVWVASRKARRDRLSGKQRAQLARLGIDWA